MNIYNRFIIFTKRIMSHKIYVALLAVLVLLTCIFNSLPQKKRSADIYVVLYFEEENNFTAKLMDELSSQNSLYNFEQVNDSNTLLNAVKSHKAECGYYFPAGFWEDYITGEQNLPATKYVLPSSTLDSNISETVFSNILEITASEILQFCVEKPEYNAALEKRLYDYMHGDKIFELESTTEGSFSIADTIYKINLPLFEITQLLVLFSALLGGYIYLRDSEKAIYTALGTKERFIIRSLTIITALLPITLTGILCCLILKLHCTAGIILFCLAAYIAAVLLSLIVKKSSSYAKLLPLITFTFTIIIFVTNLM